VEISIKQAYNATDWFLSFQRIAEANNINGQIMASARSLQRHIDDTYLEFQQCK
jgi:predicted membrane chloride channel (bestrophin family)